MMMNDRELRYLTQKLFKKYTPSQQHIKERAFKKKKTLLFQGIVTPPKK